MGDLSGISVIVPVYNTADDLERCIGSIMAQDYKDLEILLTDDGSTDESPLLCRRFARSDSRIRVIQKEHGGSTSARKAGLAAAKKEYVIFADSDDWMEPDFYGRLVRAAETSGADIVAGGHINDGWGQGSDVWKIVSAPCFRRGCYGKEDLNETFFSHFIYAGDGYFEWGISPSLCDKLFRKSVIAPFLTSVDERIWDGEDACCLYPMLLQVSSLYLTDICGYHHVMRQNSLCHVHDAGYFVRLKYLQEYLSARIKDSPYEAVAAPQVSRYVFEMALKNIEMFYRLPIRFSSPAFLFPFEKIPRGSRIALYGAGKVGQEFYRQLAHGQYATVVVWVDQNWRETGLAEVKHPDALYRTAFDYVVVAVSRPDSLKEITDRLALRYQVAREKIIALDSYCYKNNYGIKELGF